MPSRFGVLAALALASFTARPAFAQFQQNAPATLAAAQPNPAAPQYYYVPATSEPRTSLEMSTLYVASAAYGVGMGVWLSSELGIDDPALFLIPPALLGVGGPVGAYLWDRGGLERGVPAAAATGMLIGAGEGLAVWSYQYARADEADAWGYRGFSRAEALGATLGAAGGIALGYLQAPSPRSSLLVSSSVVWGSAIGGMFGYGASSAGVGYGGANDSGALGGLIGFNVGLGAAAALSTVYIPSYTSLRAMWLGAGIGAVASLPVYLFYAGKGGPPAKRGLIFSATATLLGLGAGALLTLDSKDAADADTRPSFARLHGIVPLSFDHGAGLALSGELR